MSNDSNAPQTEADIASQSRTGPDDKTTHELPTGVWPQAEATATAPLSESLTQAFSGLRYSPLRFHDQGGLGRVFVARDDELGREVALKRIREDKTRTPSHVDRFRREGEITGRLEHPGVVPVYGLGVDGAGVPYYAMRFIRGATLRAAMDEFLESLRSQRTNFDSLPFRQLLSRFIATCNVIAFAHSRGVVHRDIKPANVMLGEYGETLVVDWGLAKVLGQEERLPVSSEETVDQPANLSADSTEIGEVLGTPAFMSPEQAHGQWTEVGPASDIFSLGAVLYQLLTGEPPYRGKSPLEVVDRARRCAYEPPRHRQPAVPPALNAVCLKAMKANPALRYSSAQELAADLERWLADEPVTAFREPWTARASRWIRRHRTVVATAAGVLPLLVVGAMIYAVNSERHRREIDRERGEAVEARNDAEENFRLALANSVTAGDLADELKVLAGSNRRSLERIVAATEASLQQLLARAKRTDVVREQQVRQLNALSDLYMDLGDVRRAQDRAERALAIADELAAQQPDDDRRRADRAVSCERLAAARFWAGDSNEALRLHRLALDDRRQLAERSPTDESRQSAVAQSLFNIGTVSFTRRDEPEQWSAHEEALKIRRSLGSRPGAPAKARADLAESLMAVTFGHETRGETPAARAAMNPAREIAAQLARDDPSNATWAKLHAEILMEAGHQQRADGAIESALAMYAQSRELCENFLRLDPENHRWFQGRTYAIASHEEMLTPGRRAPPTESIVRLQQNVRDIDRLSERYPDNLVFRQWRTGARLQLAVHHFRAAQLGDAPEAHRAAAAKLLREAQAGQDQLIRRDPDRGQWIWSFRGQSNLLALVLDAQGQAEESRRVSSTGAARWLEFCERRSQRNPDFPLWQHELGMALCHRGFAAKQAERIPDAIADLSRGTDLLAKAAAGFPKRIDWARDAAVYLGSLSLVRLSAGDPAGHLADTRTAYAVRKRIFESDPTNETWLREFVEAGDLLIFALLKMNQSGEAESLFAELRGPWARSLELTIRRVAAPRSQAATVGGAAVDAGVRSRDAKALRELIDLSQQVYAGAPSVRTGLQLVQSRLRFAEELDPAQAADAGEIHRQLTEVGNVLREMKTKWTLIAEEERCLTAIDEALKTLKSPSPM